MYARLDLMQSGVSGQIGLGVVNAGTGSVVRRTEADKESDQRHLTIGEGGFGVSLATHTNAKTIQLGERATQRPVLIPDRWIRAMWAMLWKFIEI